MRAWRALKSTGAAALRDGVYLLPEGSEQQAAFAEVAADIDESGGQAILLTTEPLEYPFASLFDRTEEYRQLAVDIQDSLRRLDDRQNLSQLERLISSSQWNRLQTFTEQMLHNPRCALVPRPGLLHALQ